MKKLFETIEMPLVEVLFEMEKNGVHTDLKALAAIALQTDQKLQVLSKQIYEIAGYEFNINSPKQRK